MKISCIVSITILIVSYNSKIIAQSWLPDTVGCGCQVVRHAGYTLAYDECHEQARWVAYVLTRERLKGDVPRKGNDRFFPDTTVATGSATDHDYGGSGYTRGHLAPAAEMKWSVTAMRESFLMSNISPQKEEFNNGIWKRAEELVRSWAVEFDSLYIVTGPVLDYDLPQFTGRDGNVISIPRQFYKVVYDPVRHAAIALLIEHRDSKKPLAAFAVTVDEVERATGIDFFPGIQNEEVIESTLCKPCWSW